MTVYYTNEHEWIRVEGDIGVVGITAYAAEKLGDVVFVEVPDIGRKVKKDGDMAVVESVKAASDVYAPVTGEVVAANDKLADDLEILSRDPFGDGWIARIKITDDSALKNLMDYAAYQKQCEEESH